MNIVCENCNTVYRFDASKIPPGGKKVKCSNCQHIFMAMPTSEEADLRTLEPDAESAGDDPEMEQGADGDVDVPRGRADGEGGDKRKQRLLLRQDGTRYAVSDLATLQRWIVERRVTREAELSLDGEVWEKVAERMDLLPFFSIVEKSRSKKKSRREVTGESPLPGALPREKREKPVRPGQGDGAAPGLRVATTLHAAEGDGEGATGLAFDPAPDAAPLPREGGSPGASLALPDGGAVEDDRPAPVIALNRTAPATPSPMELARAEAEAQVAPAGNPAAKAIYAITILVLILGVGYVARTRLSGPGVAVVSSQPDRREGSGVSQPGAPPANPASVQAPAPAGAEGVTTAGGPPPAEPAVEHVSAGNPRVIERESPPAAGGEPLSAPGPSGAGPEHVARPAPQPAPLPVNHVAPAPPRNPPPAEAKQARVELREEYHPPAGPTGATARLLREGQTDIEKHRFQEAVETLKKAAEQSPGNAVVHKELARAYLNLADESYTRRSEYLQDVVDSCKKAVAIKSNYAEAYHLMGVAQMSLKQNGEAIKNLKAAIQYGIRGDDATEVRSFLSQLEGDGGGGN